MKASASFTVSTSAPISEATKQSIPSGSLHTAKGADSAAVALWRRTGRT